MRECLQGLVHRREQCFEVEITNSALDHFHSPDFQCNVPLGMESGRIANEQISASSTYSDGMWKPQQSRLHGDDNGWTPNLDSNKEYLQVLTQMPEGVPSVYVLVDKEVAPLLERTKDTKNLNTTHLRTLFIHPSRQIHVPGTNRLCKALY